MPLTMHVLVAPDDMPNFRHLEEFVSSWGLCLTVRGEPHCTCGRYALCDPLVVACPSACACACHQEHA
jgi:hypothetical protein